MVYGGADRFTAATPQKFGSIALNTLNTYAPNPINFAQAMGLDPGADQRTTLRHKRVHELTFEKLRHEPIEDFRIDFEDGYGFRPDEVEDGHAINAADELASSFNNGTITPFCGFRVKSLAFETKVRSERTLSLFLDRLVEKTGGSLPTNFVVTLPKVISHKEVKHLVKLLKKFEQAAGLAEGAIGVELMIETPEAIYDSKGKLAIAGLIEEADGRCTSAHFGAYDYTASLGISAQHQTIDHPAAELARQLMLISLSRLGIRLSDSVTTQIPLPIHRGDELTDEQLMENRSAIFDAWRIHFRNVRRSMASGFYQSWDLHPNQLPARYAAVYSFYLDGFDEQARRLRAFVERAAQASLTGSTFDDAASARGLVTYFERGVEINAFSESEVESATGRNIIGLRGLFSGGG